MDSKQFQIKICGVTGVSAVQAVAAAGADAIGLNFYPQSPRFLATDLARSVAAVVPATIQKVGVFANESPPRIRSAVEDLSLDWVQLHGAEPPEFLVELAPTPVLRAFRIRDMNLNPVVRYLDECRRLSCCPEAVLLDAHDKKQLGGTGQSLDWQRLSEMIVQLGEVRWVLAGGLGPDNVAEAIRQVRPDAVDTASGVESSPGEKDPDKVNRFVRSARSAFGDAPP